MPVKDRPSLASATVTCAQQAQHEVSTAGVASKELSRQWMQQAESTACTAGRQAAQHVQQR